MHVRVAEENMLFKILTNLMNDPESIKMVIS